MWVPPLATLEGGTPKKIITHDCLQPHFFISKINNMCKNLMFSKNNTKKSWLLYTYLDHFLHLSSKFINEQFVSCNSIIDF